MWLSDYDPFVTPEKTREESFFKGIPQWGMLNCLHSPQVNTHFAIGSNQCPWHLSTVVLSLVRRCRWLLKCFVVLFCHWTKQGQLQDIKVTTFIEFIEPPTQNGAEYSEWGDLYIA